MRNFSKKLAYLFTFILTLNIAYVIYADAAAGSEDNPILIYTQTSFSNATEDKYYKLAADINIKNPISFIGKLDGGGHTINNMSDTPLFEINSGTIKNLTVKSSVQNKNAGFVKTNTGVISDCYSIVNINSDIKTTSNCTAAGIALFNKGVIEKSHSIITGQILTDGRFFLSAEIGGIAHDNTDGTISNCYSEINISKIELKSTALNGKDKSINYAGIALKGGTVENCYSENKINYTAEGSGDTILNLYGISQEGNYKNSYYVNTDGYTYTGGTKVNSITNLKPSSWDFNSIWTIDSNFNDSKPYLLPSKLYSSFTSKTLYAKETAIAEIKLTSASLYNEKAMNFSSDSNCVSVDNTGKITAVKEGDATITISYKGVTTDIKINVPKVLTDFTLKENNINLYMGKKYLIEYDKEPLDAETGKITYLSDNNEIITISAKGEITPIKKGTASVTVKTQNNAKEAVINVNVLQPTSSIQITPSSSIVKIGDTITFTAAVSPQDADDLSVIWEIDSDIIESTIKGDNNEIIEIKALKEGTVNIKAVTNDVKNTSTSQLFILSQIEGDGTQLNPYKIFNASQLNDIRHNPDSNYILCKDIDLTDYNLLPITSIDNPFTGVLDGNGYKISNHSIKSNELSAIGLFAANKGTIKNLKIENSNLSGTASYAGFLCGKNEGDISSVTVSGNIKLNSKTTVYAGGIAGYSKGNINTCNLSDGSTIYANTSKGKAYAGGIAGEGVKISDCTVLKSEIITNAPSAEFAGGIAGYAEIIEKCVNNASVSANASNTENYAAGIAAGIKTSIDDCTNNGNISAIGYAGGIISNMLNEQSQLRNCINNGDISLADVSGGIAANSFGKISLCENNGKITAYSSAAGISGVTYPSSEITRCKNTGSVNTGGNNLSNIYAGGISANNSGNITLSFNSGHIKAVSSAEDEHNTVYSGGISGYSSGAISDCYNMGNVNSPGNCGGIIGSLVKASVSKCYNIGKITCISNKHAYNGGIIGNQTGSSAYNCYYLDTAAKQGIGLQSETNINISAAAAKTENQLKNEITFIGYDFDSIWNISTNTNNGFPYLVSVKPNLPIDEEPDNPNPDNPNPDNPNPDNPNTKNYTVSNLTFTNLNGSSIQKPSKGKFIAKVTVNENTPINENIYIIIAVYDNSGALHSFNFTFTDINSQSDIGTYINAPEGGFTIKAFVWDSLNTMTPLSNIVSK